MSKFLLGDVCVKTTSEKPNGQGQKAEAKTCRSGRSTRVLLARRLRQIREEKGLSQSDVSHLVTLRKAYISRVEGAEHMPPLRILRRWARALEVPLYQFFYDGKTRLEQLRISELKPAAEVATSSAHKRYVREMEQLLPRLSEPNRKLLLEMAETIHRRRPRRLPLSPRQAISRAIAG